MPVEANITTAGIKDALRVLNDIDKRARRQITQDYKVIVQPLVEDAQRLVPKEAPLSGMDRNWAPAGRGAVLPFGAGGGRAPRVPRNWQQTAQGRRQMGKWLQWQAGIKGYVSGKRPVSVGGYTRNLAAFGVKWQGPAAVLFDTSGQSSTPQGAIMVAQLTRRFGSPSRVMWRAYQSSSMDIQDELNQLIREIMRRASQEIAYGD